MAELPVHPLTDHRYCTGIPSVIGQGKTREEKALSPERIAALKEKYHYYIIGFALPEDCTLRGCVVYLVMTNMPGLVQVGQWVFWGSG